MAFIPFTVLVLGASILSVNAQMTPAPGPAPPAITPAAVPLTQLTFSYPNLPYQVEPQSPRGPQSGYNICNSTTEGPTSMCQTMFVNTIDDFCLWGSATPNGIIGNIEAEVVAYCTKAGHGTRLIPPGALTAVQFIKAPGYIQLTGLFDQSGIGLTSDDAGGELDPHGADLAGNPLGGLVFSNNLPTLKDNKTIVQVNNWNNFIGGNQFCIKACDNTITSPDYCENTFDTQGCNFNMPASYKPNEFSSCLGENQAPAGAAPVIPATSQCTTYQSTDLYSHVSTSTAAASTAKPTAASATTAKPSGATTPKSSNAASANTISGAAFFAVASSIVMGAFAGVVVVM